MKVGSIGYSTAQGLGYLLKDFYDHQIVNNVFTVLHPTRANHMWYGHNHVCHLNRFEGGRVREFAQAHDIMIFFETPFDMELISWCRRAQVKTILMPMYECTPMLSYLELPHKIWNPSYLDQYHFPIGEQVGVPVPDWVKWKPRTTAEVFVHNAGHLGLDGRNGTLELLEAIKYVTTPARFIIRAQDTVSIPKDLARNPNVEVVLDTVPKEELYSQGDVFVFPEKFNGLSLPLQEAFASGMLVMATDRLPNNRYLPPGPLIPTESFVLSTPWKREISKAVLNPITIANHIDSWYGKPIEKFSKMGKTYRTRNGWDYWKHIYLGMLEELDEEAY